MTAISAVLILSGCSSEPTANNSDTHDSSQSPEEQPPAEQAELVYQFDEARVVDEDEQVPFVSTDADGAITVRLSPDLAAAIPDDLDVAIDYYVVTTKAFSTGVCRIDAQITYAEGGQEALSEATSEYSSEPLQNVAGSIIDLYPGTEEKVQIVAESPSDDAIDNETIYMTSDGSTLTIVDDCSEDVGDTDFAEEIEFPYTALIDDKPYRQSFATAYVAVVPGGGQSGGDGTTTVITGEVKAEVGPNGTWRQKGE